MKGLIIYLWLSIFPFLPGTEVSNACEYAGSNLSYIKSNTEKAINADKIKMIHYYAYKALSAIDKSNQQFEDCGCEYAQQSIEGSKEYLKKAIKASTILSARMLLEKALEHARGSEEALEDHAEIHSSEYGTDLLAVNTKESAEKRNYAKPIGGKDLEDRIDASLISFEVSLQKVINTLPCQEANAYVTQVFERCELQLLKNDLTEGKRYYNLRTKEIAKSALVELSNRCP
ncbi:MAG: hypothetical protein KJO16_02995 [Muriicola sp.]|nr:hypothetical protein [Muriicola sp.]NNK10149.1 hypothetical protein [Flavobacteriaceae bacterium]